MSECTMYGMVTKPHSDWEDDYFLYPVPVAPKRKPYSDYLDAVTGGQNAVSKPE